MATPHVVSIGIVFAATLACSHVEKVQPAQAKAGAVPPASGPAPFRRVVTGVDAGGRSVITDDGPVPKAARASVADFGPDILKQAPFLRYVLESDAMWFGALPLPAGAPVDPLLGPPLEPGGFVPRLPTGGFAAAMMTWAPGGPEFPMHDSATVDLVAVIAGAVELKLENGSTVVRAGDVVVQRGTKHTWRVVGSEPCTVFTVLLDATGSASTR